MISAISWVPKGASKSTPTVADPPPPEEIQELIANHATTSGDSDIEDASDEVAQALTVADVVGKSSTDNCDDIALALKDLDMDHYDDEDEGVEVFSSGKGDLYYKSNDVDEYLIDKKGDDSEEFEDMIINPTDSVIVYACTEDDVSYLEIDEVQPCVVLGGYEEKKKKGKKKLIKKYKDDSHTDSVLGLAWNKEFSSCLESSRPQVLLSGSFDHTVVMKDGRMPSHSGYKWSVTADVESLAWDPHTEHSFVVSLEDGIVKGFDIRTAHSDSSSDLGSTFTLHAHDKPVTSVSYNPSAPNVKLWDLSNNQPSCVASKSPRAGAIFKVSFSEDNPFLLAIGGSKGKLQMGIFVCEIM
ncbi:hypothetical protein Fmac_030437 [Flemingia macrophylla]|uniref:Transducin/WD40 repeat-like superfamily protein n=1 Tax=Flemingia macrophylla TaxID=520843 RepID=A0ABD1KZ76_9FABA